MENDPKPVVALFVPEYAGPERAQAADPHRQLAKLAAWFGALPLILGLLDFLLWGLTKSSIFEVGGGLIMLLGLVCTVMGGILLLILLLSLRGEEKIKVFFHTSRTALILLIANYPAALGIVFLVRFARGF